MRFPPSIASLLLLAVAAACGSDSSTACCATAQESLRVINAFTTPVDVLVDGAVVIPALAPASIDTAAPASGSHTLVLRPVGPGVAQTRSITSTPGALSTVAAVRSSSGGLGSAVLDDTNSVVPAGATKVRVLHLAPNAGTLQVYRTQPDFQTPISWQFPFNYQPDPTSLTAPFLQSTVGTWEIRVWQTPADSTGWTNAPLRITLQLRSGEKKTVLILDKPGGGLRLETL
ncbi:MAG TPA: DUF4397 domain-containing protein [Gemmatimonadaceae bacterium]|nr:DUF4397 domain-containing protein [Gemmatimonadaceae bacterium]